MRGRRRVAAAATAALLAGLVGLAACSEPAARERPDPAPASPAPEPTASDTTPPVADTDHAVDPPGERDGRLWSADVLVQWDKPIDDALLARIEDLRGVAHTERIGLGQVSLENRVLTVAAVDPGAYRHFTQAEVADLQEAWDRVAGGELAIDRTVAERVADPETGMVRLGADDAPSLHVGAYTPQLPTIDMVVNTAWADDIGMDTDNGLLISTDAVAPAGIRKPLQRLVGEDASVQMLDVASRLGLDPDARLTAVPAGGTLGSVVGTFRYQVLGGGRIAPEPAWVAASIRTESVPILGSVTCHKDLFPQLRAALLEVEQRGLADEIDPGQYAGCYYPRFIAGTTTLSNHSFGLALDLNTRDNQRGTVGAIDRDVVAILKTWGFAWGGDWRWTDPMHFELAEVKRVG
ncbi:M15 family metallopeptidase [Nocardioides sp. zg-1228]|uniref:M15 family metallopeptidase n=1 Tax=Nocardioides sp. zg-1228 TaxID=2763008 RepID=UPI0016435E18|nr:M15 family metallopeptidase [Nocardioides sp. zg-1228]MBC2932199.1 M15 family metallopeptidase [Nocardioides sp. zg-1228]QSF57733.1 M15 family metallopeptidase [Nocardioides sp. zg-1228]